MSSTGSQRPFSPKTFRRTDWCPEYGGQAVAAAAIASVMFRSSDIGTLVPRITVGRYLPSGREGTEALNIHLGIVACMPHTPLTTCTTHIGINNPCLMANWDCKPDGGSSWTCVILFPVRDQG